MERINAVIKDIKTHNALAKIIKLEDINYQLLPHLIPSNNKNESLSLYKQQLLCIKAEGNYANVFYLDAEQVKSKLIRNTLTNIISRIEDEDIKRCQISYIINFDKVKRAYGNAKNIKLQIEELDFDIAVSRKFPIKDIYKLK